MNKSRCLQLLVSGLVVMAGASSALAQQTPVERARSQDASNDRGLLTSRADTLREGEFSVNAYELFFIGGTYAFTDDFQVSFTTFPPIVEDTPFLGIFNAKYVLMRSATTVVSAQAEGLILRQDGVSAGTFGPSVQVDHHLADGAFVLHGQLSAQGVFGGFEDEVEVGEGVLVRMSAGVSAPLGEHVKLLGEVFVPAAFADGEFEVAEVALVNYGLRFHGGTIAADQAFLRPFGIDDNPFILGIPFLGFSARF